jgi:hypothetical protein
MNHLVELESDYEYVLGSVMGNVLNLQATFSSMDWAKSDLELISKELVNTAKLFAVQQGLGATSFVNDVSVNGTPVQIKRKQKNTGTLINSIHADVVGSTINFFNNANLGRGFYAGHIEYGFHDRAGNPVAARPFMRPAFQAVARASTGHVAGTLRNFLEQGLMFKNYAKFGTPLTSSGNLRAFYNQPRGPIRGIGAGTYTTQGLLNSRMNRQSFWKEGFKKGDFGVNKSNRILGTVRDREQSTFVGRGNGRVSMNIRSPSFLTGNTQTSSTRRYGTQKWGVKHSNMPKTYKGYGKMNRNIPGRQSRIKQSTGTSSRKTASSYKLTQRNFATKTVTGRPQYKASDGSIHSSYHKAEKQSFKADKSLSVEKIIPTKTVTSYSGTSRTYRVGTKSRR